MFRLNIFLLLLFISQKLCQCKEVKYAIFMHTVKLYYICDPNSHNGCINIGFFNVPCPEGSDCVFPGKGLNMTLTSNETLIFGVASKLVFGNTLILPTEVSCDYKSEYCFDTVLKSQVYWKYDKCYDKYTIFQGNVTEEMKRTEEVDLRFVSFEYRNNNYTLQLLAKNEDCNVWETDQNNIFASEIRNDVDIVQNYFPIEILKSTTKNSIIPQFLNDSNKNIVSRIIQLMGLLIVLLTF